jgi:hypothetical protein
MPENSASPMAIGKGRRADQPSAAGLPFGVRDGAVPEADRVTVSDLLTVEAWQFQRSKAF